MINKNKPDKDILLVITIVSPIAVFILSLFNSGRLISMPESFPYSRGIWNAIGTGSIILISFIVLVLSVFFYKKFKK